jgi:hypothetical protein
LQCHVDWYKFTNVSEVCTACIIIALMLEAVQTSEKLVNSYQSTWRYNPEDSHLQKIKKFGVWICMFKPPQKCLGLHFKAVIFLIWLEKKNFGNERFTICVSSITDL